MPYVTRSYHFNEKTGQRELSIPPVRERAVIGAYTRLEVPYTACTTYAPGHVTHWIAARRARQYTQPIPAKILEIDGNWITFQPEGMEVRRTWTHDIANVRNSLGIDNDETVVHEEFFGPSIEYSVEARVLFANGPVLLETTDPAPCTALVFVEPTFHREKAEATLADAYRDPRVLPTYVMIRTDVAAELLGIADETEK